MKFNILTLFPNMYKPLEESIIKRAREKKLIDINIINIRDFSHNKHNHVDDTPFGGGPGMIIKADVLKRSLDYAKENFGKNTYVVYLSPKGVILNNEKVVELSKKTNITLIAGHYEGVDERFIQKYVDEEISIGDYVLSGGEIPSMVLVDTISRKIDGVLFECSLDIESFEDNLLENEQYTKPRSFEGLEVPEILLSGNHEEIKKFKRQNSLKVTFLRRKDLIKKAINEKTLTKEDLKFLEKLKENNEK